ncbi:MAG: RsiV family protein [Peptostreptococcaceae bacterium]
MLSIETINIEENNNLVIYNLNYPLIKNGQYEDKIIDYINEVIYQDIISFKDVVENEIQSLMLRGNYLSYINTEYSIDFNRNSIISVTIEFSQLAGLYNITYANSYNFDIDLGRKIKLNDIFKPNINYIDIINQKLREDLENRRDLLEDIFDELEDYVDELTILDNHNFYIQEDGIVICFSSYELDKNVSELVEFKILFEECMDYLSKYAKEHIL